MIKKIISGGQTGVDRAALDVAIERGILHGGWIPKGRRTESGRLDEKYNLKETSTIDYETRTELNVIEADGTLIVSHGQVTGGLAITQAFANKHIKPCLHIDLDKMNFVIGGEITFNWLEKRKIHTLNVAGPRSSKDPLIYEAVLILLGTVIDLSYPRNVSEAIERLQSELSFKDKTRIANLKEREIHTLHTSTGLHIRVTYGLWFNNERLMESCRQIANKSYLHVEDASAVILKELWKKLKESHKIRVLK